MKTIGLIGLGKMGINIIQNMKNNSYDPIGYDIKQTEYAFLAAKNIKTAQSLDELIINLPKPRYIMLLVPTGEITEKVFSEVIEKLAPDDCVIDAGNSFYQDSIRRSSIASEKGIHFVDCGTSGGWNGALKGSCLMVGGKLEVIKVLTPFFESLAVEDGFLHTGPVGSGHYAKMIHNGIEYGMMQALAEGYEILYNSEFNYNLAKISHLWNRGSVIRSWLIELMAETFHNDPTLDNLKGVMNMNGEGLWTVQEALTQGTPAPIIALSVIMRQRSQQNDTFAGKVVAALRFAFGGHDIVKNK
ncbi:phosphogluconate dehydrogenase (NAD(+)-dependent, decarboxylating) [Spiroplasma sp. SV19]|uniref:phosphogluconate dehydrogenase (NAD(+)-dependent, decarboxylating) n=1 Tax=Spiroplasma sp. SV19 TaxID=2570468 RepID=UPI0024B73D6F|nr:decarboxylating 6-phosphogluconate dehydrogenase [Spiroplasma sp. SV19]